MKTNDEITGVCVGSTGADEPLVSVIIPVYNVRDYLADCIRSVLDQTYPRVECICVDDGSTDGSGAILDEYARRQSDNPTIPNQTILKVIHQPNAGVSAARNRALELARGGFITFLDSDDMFEPNFIELAMRDLVADPELDLWVGQVVRTDASNVASEEQPPRPPAGETTDVLADFLRYPGRQYLFSTYPKVYRWSGIRKFGFMFSVGMSNDEDALFVTELYSCLRKARISDAVVYRRRLREGSLVGRPWALQVPDSLTAIRTLLDFAPRSPRPAVVRRAAAQRALSRFRILFKRGQSRTFLRDYIRALCGHPLFRPAVCRTIVRYAPPVYRPVGLAFALAPKRAVVWLLYAAVCLKGRVAE